MQSAQTWARTQLARKFPVDCRRLYLELKPRCKNGATARNKAIAQLVILYREEYWEFYTQAKKLGYPANFNQGRK